MSTNGINQCEDAEMADCDGDKVVTMMDVLKEQEDFEEDANAVLGASDDKNCTYSKGYVKRQAIYACMTCTDAKNDPSKRAGVCLACSLTCHENHELIELYTKRNFRCDCGNPKFNSHPCTFTPDKTDFNTENVYNQNFSGVYCTCHRPYPDPESNVEGDMIQCIVCEDWLHCNHLDAVVPSNDQYSEMICKACMDKNEFLHDYSKLTITANKESMDVDVLNTSTEVNNSNESTTMEMADNKENVNSNGENAKTEKDAIVEANDETEINSEEKKSTSETSEVKVDAKENSEPTQIKSSEENVSNSETDSKMETEQKDATQSEDPKVADTGNENSNAKQSSVPEGGDAPIVKTETPDSRSQEQVEEDNLLADPEDKKLDPKNNAMDVVPSNDIKSSTELTDEKKSESDTMEVSNDETKNAATSETGNIISEQVANETPTEHTVSATEDSEGQQPDNTTTIDNTVPETEKLEDVSGTGMTKDSESKETENKTIVDNSKDTPTNDQFESNPPTKEPEKMSTDKDQPDENNITSENSTGKEKSEDTGKDKNIDEAKSNGVQKDTEINNGHNELSNKTIESDILKRKLSTDGDSENVEVKKAKLEGKCVRPKGVKKVHHGATFWPSNFRHKLCTCNECLAMYKDLSVLFLIDPEDTVTAYEQLGKEKTDGKPASQYEKGMAALSSLGRVQQINALTEYGKLRDKLLDFLKTFKDKKVIVKEEDIKAFFAGMKPVREPDGVYFCR